MVPSEIDDVERLGRGVFESRQARRRTPRTKFYIDAFSAGSMSVDRLDHADIGLLCSVHDAEAEIRRSVRAFYGWYAFTASLVRSIGMCLEFAPTESNPWHSEMSLPQNIEEDEDELMDQCLKLASESEWVPRPMNPSLRQQIEDAAAESGI